MPKNIKTYLASLILAVVGVGAILAPDTSTWTAPSGITKDIIGVVALMLAAATASLRHAIATAKAQILSEILISRAIEAVEKDK